MSIGRWMGKEVVVHIHRGILFSYIKQHIWVSSNEVDEPGASYREWNKSERKRQTLYINAYTWNLERWYQWSYMLGSKGDTGIKNRLLDSVGGGEGGIIWENSVETCTLPYAKQMTRASSMHETGHPKRVVWDNPEGLVGREEGGMFAGGHMYTCGWFMLMYDKGHHNIVNYYSPIKIS